MMGMCIADLAEMGVYLLSLGVQLGAPILSNRVVVWTDLMNRFKSLQYQICSSTGLEAEEIPQRYGHSNSLSNLLDMSVLRPCMFSIAN